MHASINQEKKGKRRPKKWGVRKCIYRVLCVKLEQKKTKNRESSWHESPIKKKKEKVEGVWDLMISILHGIGIRKGMSSTN